MHRLLWMRPPASAAGPENVGTQTYKTMLCNHPRETSETLRLSPLFQGGRLHGFDPLTPAPLPQRGEGGVELLDLRGDRHSPSPFGGLSVSHIFLLDTVGASGATNDASPVGAVYPS
jgi:hypothetical protein